MVKLLTHVDETEALLSLLIEEIMFLNNDKFY